MIKWIKRLFCRHEWSPYWLTTSESVYLCSKCQMLKKHVLKKNVFLGEGMRCPDDNNSTPNYQNPGKTRTP